MTTIEITPALKVWSARVPARAVEGGAIRRFADAIGSDDPLWRDPEYARAHGFRAPVAPPTFLDGFKPFYTGAPYPLVPDDLPHSLSASDEFHIVEPVCAGDVIDTETRLTGVQTRRRSDGVSRIVFVTYETVFKRLTGHVVCREHWTGAWYEGGSTALQPAVFAAPDGDMLEVPAVTVHTDRVAIARWAGAVGDWERIHIDEPYAVDEMGLLSVVGHGTRTTALLARVLTDWAGPAGRIRVLRAEYRGLAFPGDELHARAFVRRSADGEPGFDRYQATMAVTDQADRVITRGSAVVDLPTGRSAS